MSAPRWSTALAIATLALPILVLAGMTGRAEWQRESGIPVRVPITGYDPRDPLRGHYLVYRIDWNWEDASEASADDPVLCVMGRGDNPPVRPMPATAETSDCSLVIMRNPAVPGGFMPRGLSGQLFVDEAQAPVLQGALRQGSGKLVLDLGVMPDGSVRIRDWRADKNIFAPPPAP